MKQEDFIPGRWYRSTAEANNRGGEIYYGKFLKFRNDAFVASSARVSGSIIDLKYMFNSGYIWELVTDLTEIQHLLPTNHPDKIMKPAPEAIMEVFGKFIIGNIVVSLRTNLPWREEGDMFTILPNSKQDMLYYKPSTHSQDRDDWRLATTKECHAYHNGVKNIKQMDSPKETTKPVVSQFLKDDYIVVLQEVSVSFPKNHVFKQRETASYLRVYKDIRGDANGNTIAKFTKTSVWRYATSQEIMEYDIQGKPVDVTKIGMVNVPVSKEDNMKSILEECKRRYPVGTKYYCADNGISKYTVVYQNFSISGSMIFGESNKGCLYARGNYASIIKDVVPIPSNAKKWAVKRTHANCDILNKWANSQDGTFGHSSAGGWIHSINYGYGGHTGGGHYYADDTKHPDHTEITTDQFKREYMNDEPGIPKYVKVISYDSKYTNHIFSTNDPPPKEFCNSWETILLNNKRLEDGSFIPATREEYEAFINNSKPQSTMANKSIYANKSLEEMLVICRQMFPKGCKYRKKDEIGERLLDQDLIIQSAGAVVNNEKGISNIGLPWFFFNGTMRVERTDTPKAEIKPHAQPTKEASKEELLAYCKKMYPIGTVIQGGYVVTKELVWESSAFISHHGLGIVYNQRDHTFANILSFRDVQEPTKTLKDLPKKATLSDVSALVKHQEPVIAFSKKAKRSKLVIINK